jgi:hypothetical protein
VLKCDNLSPTVVPAAANLRPEIMERTLALLASLATDGTSGDEIIKRQGVSAIVKMFESRIASSR